MKKIILGIFALSTLALANQETQEAKPYVNLRVGVDVASEYSPLSTHDDVSEFALGSETDGIGYELAVEYMIPSNERLDFGFGIAFQDHAEREDYSFYADDDYINDGGLDYKSIPVYFTAQYKLFENSKFDPYLKANLGYSFNFDERSVQGYSEEDGGDFNSNVDVRNGLYFGVGIGAEYENFTIDLMYSVNKATATIDQGEDEYNPLYDLDVDADYERVTLSFGYKFNLD